MMTEKLGTMELEIRTNADKALKEVDRFGKGSSLALGAVGGVAGMLGLSFMGLASSVIQSAPNVKAGLSKMAAGARIIGVNSNESLGFVNSLGDALIEMGKEGGKLRGINLGVGTAALIYLSDKDLLLEDIDDLTQTILDKFNDLKGKMPSLYDLLHKDEEDLPVAVGSGEEQKKLGLSLFGQTEESNVYNQFGGGQSSAFPTPTHTDSLGNGMSSAFPTSQPIVINITNDLSDPSYTVNYP